MKPNKNIALVSVVMPVFNSEAYLEEAVMSILNQTYTNFELLLINDGSMDNSEAIAKKLIKKDSRIVYLNNGVNRGVAYTRNVGLNNAKGELLCWMDSDDTCHPERIERQVLFLLENLEIGAVGTQIQRFDGKNSFQQTSLNGNSQFIKASLLFRPAAVPNATVMLRTELIKKYQLLYNEEIRIGEDYDFVSRCSHHFPFSILPQVLYNYRVAENSITEIYNSSSKKTYENVKNTYKFHLKNLGLAATEENLLIHDALVNPEMLTSYSIFKKGVTWLKSVEQANLKSKTFDKNQFRIVLKEQYVFFGKKAGPVGLKGLVHYTKMGLQYDYFSGIKNWIKVAIRSFLKYDHFVFEWSQAFGKRK